MTPTQLVTRLSAFQEEWEKKRVQAEDCIALELDYADAASTLIDQIINERKTEPEKE